MLQKEVICSYCKDKFLKSIKKIKETEKLGKQHACSRRCAAKISNASRHSVPKTRNAEHTRRDRERYPERDLARRLIRQAIKTGKIETPLLCESCFDECKLEAHHEDHYQPYLITWLCKDCHAFHDKHKIMGLGTDYSEQIDD